jgi:hypothetical protein
VRFSFILMLSMHSLDDIVNQSDFPERNMILVCSPEFNPSNYLLFIDNEDSIIVVIIYL